MTFLERAIRFLGQEFESPIQVDPLPASIIINAISNNSNVWNLAATKLVADHDQNLGRSMVVINYPIIFHNKKPIRKMALSNFEWNKRALERSKSLGAQ